MMPARLLLASSSRYRIQQLQALGLEFESRAHCFDERAVQFVGDPAQHALNLATGKAQSLRDEFPEFTILGCDQVACIDSELLHKPMTRERAIEQLDSLQGRTHVLATAFTLLSPTQPPISRVDTQALTMRKLSRKEIRRYVDHDQPLDCCGSYKIEAQGIALFEQITGDDFTAIQGLPLRLLCGALRHLGIDLP